MKGRGRNNPSPPEEDQQQHRRGGEKKKKGRGAVFMGITFKVSQGTWPAKNGLPATEVK